MNNPSKLADVKSCEGDMGVLIEVGDWEDMEEPHKGVNLKYREVNQSK